MVTTSTAKRFFSILERDDATSLALFQGGASTNDARKLGIAVYTRGNKARIYVTPRYVRHVSAFMVNIN